jgi:hypothetical protein
MRKGGCVQARQAVADLRLPCNQVGPGSMLLLLLLLLMQWCQCSEALAALWHCGQQAMPRYSSFLWVHAGRMLDTVQCLSHAA